MGEERSFFTPISLWRVLCEWSAVVTAPLMLPSSHGLSLHGTCNSGTVANLRWLHLVKVAPSLVRLLATVPIAP